MAFKYTGFDGNSYKTNEDLPSIVNDYDYFLIFNMGGYTRIVLFNEITVEFKDNAYFISCPEGGSFRYMSITATHYSWSDHGEWTNESISSSFTITYSSENLHDHVDLLLTNNFTIPILETESNLYTLRPIVEEVDKNDNIVETTFNDIFGMLPVLIVVLIGFIGIRKGISYLFNLLRRS